MRRLLPLLLLLLLLSTASADGNSLLTGDASSAVPPITLYQGPSAHTEPVAYCYPGAQAQVLDQGSGFVQIRIGQLTGWVAREQLLYDGEWTADDALPLPAGEVAAQGVERYQYLYDSPDGQPFAALERHFTVSVAAITADDEWLLAQLPDGTTGYLPVETLLPSGSASHAYVTSSEPSLRLHLRTEPTTKCDSLGNYYCGTEVSLLFSISAPEGWTRVAVCGQKGWMKTEFLAFTDHIGAWLPPLGVVQGTDESGLNLRKSPDYDAEIITRYAPGAVVEIMAVYGVWAHVRTQDGCSGYMLLHHLGGDQPAATPNSVLFDGTAVRLLSSRPVCAWQYTASGTAFALPETCAVANELTGEIIAAPTSALPVWAPVPAE